MGIPGHDEDLDDFSPAGHAAHSDAAPPDPGRARRGRRPVDDIDRVTVVGHAGAAGPVRGDLRRRPGRDVARRHRLAHPGHPQRLRPDADRHRRAVGGHRHPPGARCRRPCEQYVESLRRRRGRGNVSAAPPGRGVHRPVRGVHRRRRLLRHARRTARAAGGEQLDRASVAEASPRPRRPRPAPTPTSADPAPRDPAAGARVRRLRPRALRSWSRAPSSAPPSTSRRPTPGARTSWPGSPPRWSAVAEQIQPGATVKEAIDAARRRPGRTSCTAPTRCAAWMQEQADEAIAEPGRHRTSTSRSRSARIECRIAPTHDGRHLLHRPERGLQPPGPHVVVGAQGRHRVRHLARADHRLPRGRPRPPPPGRPDRLPLASCSTAGAGSSRWVSGHGEGWALYAERLMADLGYLDDPGNRMGMLDGQSLRAARVVLDIGVPLRLRGTRRGRRRRVDLRQGLEVPVRARQHGRGLPALRARPLPRLAGAGAVVQDRRAALAAAARRGPRQREGDAFDLKAFHRRALDIGGVGLDTLRTAVLG